MARPSNSIKNTPIIPDRKIVSADQRQTMIAEAAYYLAERRSFQGDEEDRIRDWLEAETQIDEFLARGGAGFESSLPTLGS
jgi:hypothetical protein